MRDAVELYAADRGSLFRTYAVANSPARRERLRQFYSQWLSDLAKHDFDALSQDGRIDYLLFKNHLRHALRQLDAQSKQFAEVEPLLPFSKTVFELEEARRRMEPVNAPKAAALLTEMKRQVDEARRAAERADAPTGQPSAAGDPAGASPRPAPAAAKIKKHEALRAAVAASALRAALKNWFDFYNGYDPVFTWWAAEPYRAADQSLQSYASFLGERLAGVRPGEVAGLDAAGGGPQAATGSAAGQRQTGAVARAGGARPGDASDIVGDPIGREALLAELEAEMIPYTPEELIAIAEREMEWCEAEMRKAARELGFGDDWRRALEHVKDKYVEPGKQPQLIRDLAAEAVEFVERHDLVTVPAIARESWRMQMMTPERQLVNPFFTGGETISVSYPAAGMSHEQKLMSMRGNNVHFSRATVHHELIPGHHLQIFMNRRHRTHRAVFSTPFWTEGWALYWEMLLWDLKFPKTPEDRVGMLFWRMHRGARIVFSLGFHLGRMTPQEAIDLLVKRVGHEPENATAEVRRSFNGTYPPLYQAAYLLGGLQIYALRKELVGPKRMTDRQFHDAILRENAVPIEMVRASLTNQRLTRDFRPDWKFYGPAPAAR